MGVYASETANNDFVVDTIISEEEYINALIKYDNLSYDEAKNIIRSNQLNPKASSESVVTIHRKIYKTVKSGSEGTWQLVCSVYIDAIRDNVTNKYIGIQAVRAPYVDISFNNNPLGATMNGNAEATYSGTNVTVYYNGSITYSVQGLDISVEVAPGVSISGNTGYDVRYSVEEIFRTTI